MQGDNATVLELLVHDRELHQKVVLLLPLHQPDRGNINWPLIGCLTETLGIPWLALPLLGGFLRPVSLSKHSHTHLLHRLHHLFHCYPFSATHLRGLLAIHKPCFRFPGSPPLHLRGPLPQGFKEDACASLFHHFIASHGKDLFRTPASQHGRTYVGVQHSPLLGELAQKRYVDHP